MMSTNFLNICGPIFEISTETGITGRALIDFDNYSESKTTMPAILALEGLNQFAVRLAHATLPQQQGWRYLPVSFRSFVEHKLLRQRRYFVHGRAEQTTNTLRVRMTLIEADGGQTVVLKAEVLVVAVSYSPKKSIIEVH